MDGEISKIELTNQETSVIEGVSFTSNENVSVPIKSQPIEEMLGSVTTYNNIEGSDVFGATKNIQQLRTSARVFKKMKLDSALATPIVQTPEKDKKDVNKDEIKEVKKPLRPSWSQEDKDIFFEALNEYGKDFEAIQQYINNKFKKKSLPDSIVKTKDQIRHFYYRTWHKVSKHLKFSEGITCFTKELTSRSLSNKSIIKKNFKRDANKFLVSKLYHRDGLDVDVKKIAQELYALINYGELRKKVGSVSEKTCVKLNELICRGTMQIRFKGKTIRIKTPMCRALRKLNELDEKHEDLKLPTRVLVELRPKNMEAWLKVQFIAQNPRVRLSLPLQKRVSALIQCMNERWKTNIARAHEKIISSVNNVTSECLNENIEEHKAILSPLLRITPKSNCPVEVPTINLSEYLTSHRICLNAYEERIGVKTSSEQLWQTTTSGFKGGGKSHKKSQKRQRNESTGEKTIENNQNTEKNPENLSQVVNSAVNTILALQKNEPVFESVYVKVEKDVKTDETQFSQEKELEISKIKNGWNIEDCGTLTIGELYLMFGHDSKLILEYSWDPPNKLKIEQDLNKDENSLDQNIPTTSEKSTNGFEKSDENDTNAPNDLSVTLRRLLSIAKLHYRKERLQCPCGHICGPKSNSTNRTKNIASKTNQKNFTDNNEKNVNVQKTNVEVANRPNVLPQNCMRNVTIKQDSEFRRPSIYPNNGCTSSESFKAQLDSLSKMRPKYCNRKGRPLRSKHVVVERMLPLLPKPPVNGHSIVTMKVISQVTPRTILPKVENNTDSNPELNAETNTENNEDQNIEKDKINEENSVLEFSNHTVLLNTENQVNEPIRVTSPTSISNFLDLDIPNPDTNDLILGSTAEKDGITSFAGILSDDACPSTTPLSSPSRILKENDIQWLNSEVNDYSLTSLLGHLESPLKVTPTPVVGDVTISQDIDAQFTSLLGENGVDFVDQFVDMASHVTTENSEMSNL